MNKKSMNARSTAVARTVTEKGQRGALPAGALETGPRGVKREKDLWTMVPDDNGDGG